MPTPKEERETLITWTDDDTHAHVYTFNKRLWPICDKAKGEMIRSSVRDGKE